MRYDIIKEVDKDLKGETYFPHTTECWNCKTNLTFESFDDYRLKDNTPWIRCPVCHKKGYFQTKDFEFSAAKMAAFKRHIAYTKRTRKINDLRYRMWDNIMGGTSPANANFIGAVFAIIMLAIPLTIFLFVITTA